ncbi:MAG: MFS transporter [Saprospiraceae bacterium]|nr:MFS transporter [Saprospiraceae bacterium]MCF8249078.1 MFS transporter [Saprospiraceae bacterium]MCF8280945.1 MFS transporter [Bacteroidales bacterium]MCF8311100.1 MFS transporter [Saprospiraceae bacterium]MCF8440190.1 MFS transporter [Saprospiraceae bacterium]
MLARTLSTYIASFSGLSRSAWLISFASFVNRSGTMVLPFMSLYLTTELGFPLEQAGIAMTLFGFGSLTGSYLGGYLSDKIGYHRVLFWSLFLGGALFMILGFVKSLHGIYLMIFLLSSIGEAFRPATMSALAAHSKPENRTRSYSLMRMSINLGFTIGPAIGGVLAAWKGYQTLFWVDGITCMASAIFFRSILNPQKAANAEKTVEQKPLDQGILSPYRDTQYLLFLLLTTFGAIVFLQIISTLPVYYKQDMQLSEGKIGGLLALNGLIVFLMEMPLVYTLERKMKRLHCIGAGVLMYGFGFAILNSAPQSVAIAVLGMIAISIGEIFNMPFSNSYALGRTTDANRGKYMGLYAMTYSLAHISGPYFSMKIAEKHGFSTLWYLSAVLSLLTFGGFMMMKKRNPDPAKHPTTQKEELVPLPSEESS